jgi:voltage-gated potassium channel
MTIIRDDSFESENAGYQLFTLVLSLYAIFVLLIQSLLRINPGINGILDYADFVVCILFFGDFLYSLWRAPNRWGYIKTWGWLDLISSIPAIGIARLGRAARILRVFRVLRGLRATKQLTTLILRRRAENTFLAMSLVALLLTVFCSIAILHFENDSNGNIKTAEDAIWWAFVTITTVGYGDRFPVTSEGRIIAAVLMSAGVGMFGTFSGYVAAWFIRPASPVEEPREKSEITELRESIETLKTLVEKQTAKS